MNAQTSVEFQQMKDVFVTQATTPKHIEMAMQNQNEIQLLFSGLFLFYKTVFSSQDGQSCSFTPSCSEYGILMVKKNGMVVGILSTFDRLMRCHGLAPELYVTDKKTGLLIDRP